MTLAEIHRREGQFQKAEAIYRKQIERLNATLRLEEEGYSDSKFHLASAHHNIGKLVRRDKARFEDARANFEAAVEFLNSLVNVSSGDFRLHVELAEVNGALAWLYWNKDRVGLSRDYFRRACEHYSAIPENDRSTAIWGHFGQALYRVGDYESAREVLKKGIELRGDSGPTFDLKGPRWWYLAMTLHKLGERAEARHVVEALFQQMIDQGAGPRWSTPRLNEAARVLGLKNRLEEQETG